MQVIVDRLIGKPADADRGVGAGDQKRSRKAAADHARGQRVAGEDKPGRGDGAAALVFEAAGNGLDQESVRAGDDAAEACFFPFDELPPLAFETDQIVIQGLMAVGPAAPTQP